MALHAERGALATSHADIAQAAGVSAAAHSLDTARHLQRLADLHPTTLACMHGSAWKGDGAALIERLARRLAPV